jgi:small subunit ribosomal protein S26e
VRNIVDKSSLRDLSDASIIENYELPKFYIKLHYCISCAVHRKIVRPRSKVTRSSRVNPRQAMMDKFREQNRDKNAVAAGSGTAQK